MIGKKPTEHQMSIFEVALESFIDMSHELVLLSKRIDWSAVESDFAEYYCADNGRPTCFRHFLRRILFFADYQYDSTLKFGNLGYTA